MSPGKAKGNIVPRVVLAILVLAVAALGGHSYHSRIHQKGTVAETIDEKDIEEMIKTETKEILGGGIQDIKNIMRAKTGHSHIHFYFENNMPWFAESKQALFTSMVVFPKEAKVDEYVCDGNCYASCSPECKAGPVEGSARSCSCGDDACVGECRVNAAAVCPDKAFYKDMFVPFLRELARCGNADNKVVLQTVGFASSSEPENLTQKKRKALRCKLRQQKMVLNCVREDGKKSCCRLKGGCGAGGAACKLDDTESDSLLPRAFNLHMAELRARNVKNMLDEMIGGEQLGDFIEVTTEPWCSYQEMCKQRGFTDTAGCGKEGRYDTELGLMNRRVEVRVVALPGCLNLSPENRVCAGRRCRQKQSDGPA